jgi:hypothetical protein
VKCFPGAPLLGRCLSLSKILDQAEIRSSFFGLIISDDKKL